MAQQNPKDGNTKRPSQAKKWCFTWNNPWGTPPGSDDEPGELESKGSDGSMGPVLTPDVEKFLEILEKVATKYVYQYEVGEEGTHHIQGVLEFDKKARPSSKFGELWNKAHWESCRSWNKSVEYCSKIDTRVKGPFTKGVEIETIDTVTYDELRDDQKEIVDRYKEKAGKFDREIHWYWEPNGKWGKSIIAKYLSDSGQAIIIGRGASRDALCGVANWVEKNKKSPKIIVFDIPKSKGCEINYSVLEEIKNGLFFSGKYESGAVRINTPHVVVFANAPPFEELMSEDRWVIRELC